MKRSKFYRATSSGAFEEFVNADHEKQRLAAAEQARSEYREEKEDRDRQEREENERADSARRFRRCFDSAFNFSRASFIWEDEDDAAGDVGMITQGDLKSAFRKLSLKWHPDRGGTTEAQQALNEFYEELLKLC